MDAIPKRNVRMFSICLNLPHIYRLFLLTNIPAGIEEIKNDNNANFQLNTKKQAIKITRKTKKFSEFITI
jgi:hypothetical protein